MNFHNMSGAFALSLLGIAVIIGVMLVIPPVDQPDLTVGSGELSFVEVLSFEWPDPGIFMVLTGEYMMEIGSPPIAIVDLETGHVELYGDPNEAAKLFWEAVELMKP